MGLWLDTDDDEVMSIKRVHLTVGNVDAIAFKFIPDILFVAVECGFFVLGIF